MAGHKKATLNLCYRSVAKSILQPESFRCRECVWEGAGTSLSTGLVRISRSDMYLYAYRCPECGSYAVASKGQLLAFAARQSSKAIEPIQENDAAEAATPHVSVNTAREGGRAGRLSSWR